MSEKEFLVDAVAQFLQTNAWQEAINQFMESNYVIFQSNTVNDGGDKQSKGDGYTLEQYDVFTQFKDLIERQLESMMADLSCSGKDLVEILEEAVRRGPTGERRFLIKTLLSFEEYEEFHARITEYAAQRPSASEGESAEMAEWHTQLAVAQSLLEAQAQGLLDETEQSFLPWAEALLGMSTSTQPVGELDAGVEAKEDASAEVVLAQRGDQDERLKALEYTLILERLKVDLLVAQRIAEANAVLKKEMLHLSATAELDQTEDAPPTENDLDSLFVELDVVRDRLKVVKSKCFEFKSVSQEAMDQMYLYLKEKIHYQQDLVSQEKEISQVIFTHIQQSDAALIPLLLEWLLLESEGLRMQNQIQEQLGQGTSESNESQENDGFWTQSWDENALAFFYFYSVTGESVWEPPSVGFYDANQEYQIPEQSSNEASSEAAVESEEAELLSQAETDLQDRITSDQTHNADDVLDMERVLQKISKEHDEERARLELVFEVEKARQKQELRRRKEKKRRAKAAKKSREKEQEEAPTSTESQVKANDDPEQNEDGNVMAKLIAPMSLPPIMAPSAAMTSLRAEAKGDDSEPDQGLGIRVPGPRHMDLSHLLSDSHAKRQLEKRGFTLTQPPAPQALLNPTSLRYLTETLAKKNPDGMWLDKSPMSSRVAPPTEFVLEEADEK